MTINATDLAPYETTFAELIQKIRATGRNNELRELLVKELSLTPLLLSYTSITESIAQGFEAFNEGVSYDMPPEDVSSREYWQKGWVVGAQALQRSVEAANIKKIEVA